MVTDWSSRDVLVTGGAGFIGSYLTEELLSRGATVRVVDNLSRGSVGNLEQVEGDVEFQSVDLTTHKGSVEATENVDDVFHLAASVGGIHYIQRENVGGLTPSVLMNQHVLDAAARNGVDRVLFASSACVYRQTHDDLNRFSEEQAIPADPHSTYGWAKILGEVACDAYHRDTDLDTSIVRIFNCYGPRESIDYRDAHVIPSLCRKAVEAEDGGAIEVFGDGTQQRGFIHVRDLVTGLLRSIDHKADADPINLGNGSEVVEINELAEKIIDLSGKNLSIEHDPSAPAGTDKYAADTEKMEAALDWTPETPLDVGLREVYTDVAERLEATGSDTDGGLDA